MERGERVREYEDREGEKGEKVRGNGECV